MTKLGMKRTTPKKGIRRKSRTKKGKIGDQVLDGLVRHVVHLLSGGYCKRCKKYVGDSNIATAHLYRRNRKTVRWDLRNVVPLCADCHREIDNSSIKMASFMYEILSREDIEELDELANTTLVQHPIDREQIKKDLQDKIRGMDGG